MRAMMMRLSGATGSQARPLPMITPDMPAAFRQAYRHSARVRRLRRLVPVAAITTVVVLVAYAAIDPLRRFEVPLPIGTLVVSGSLLTMDAPSLSGYMKDNRAYKVNARRAEQDMGNPNVVRLDEIKAQMEMAGGDWTNLTAREGTINISSSQLVLSKGIDVTTTSGYQVHAQEVTVDTKSGTVVSKLPVQMRAPTGDLTAGALELLESGKILVLMNGVRGSFMPEAPDEEAVRASQAEEERRAQQQ